MDNRSGNTNREKVRAGGARRSSERIRRDPSARMADKRKRNAARSGGARDAARNGSRSGRRMKRRPSGEASARARSAKRAVPTRESRERRIGVLKQWGIIAGAAAAALLIIFIIVAQGYKKKFLPNTYVNGFAVGKLSVADTEEILKKSVENYNLEVSFRGGQSEFLSSEELGLTYVSSNEVEKLMENQHRFRWISSLFGKKSVYTVKTSFKYDNGVVQSHLKSLPQFSEANITSPRNSTIALDADRTFRVTSEFQGNRPVESVIYEAVDQAVNSSEPRLSLTLLEGAYAKPDVTSTDEDLLARVKDLNAWMGTNLTIKYKDGSTSVIDKDVLASWVTKDDEGLYCFDDHTVYMKIYAMMEEAARKYDEVYDKLNFESTNNGTVSLWCPTPYGYRINVDSQTEKIFSLVYSHTNGEYEIENSVRASAEDKIGDTYVEIDITRQHLYYYEDGRLVLESDFVSGLESNPERRTPSGVYALFDKVYDTVLGDPNSPYAEQRYSSHVNYWMPFYESFGMHDAEWRDEFGDDIYTWAGSHGCVNLPPSFAKKLWDNIEIWTPVIVCRESDRVEETAGTADSGSASTAEAAA